MTVDQITYIVFGIVIVVALIFDLGLFSKKDTVVSIRTALYQSIFWIGLALAFFGFMWWMEGEVQAMEYLGAYLMEKSLSVDNIFVFILIFSFFKIRTDHISRALFIGILLAVIFRIIFISLGVALVERFHWVLYVFGAFLVYTGIKIFTVRQEDEFNPANSPIYKLLNKFFPIIHEDVGGKLTIKKDGKRYYTDMFVVVILLATTDIVFALDSIPAAFAIVNPNHRLVLYTSNIFAVLGLRSLFFLLKGAVNKFEYLQQGIAIVLTFIGLKMLAEMFPMVPKVPVYISLLVIVICLVGSIGYSIQINKRRARREREQ